ncbi:hypothetical protein ACOSP7_030104 [Xanthoceras sorbifolium]
MFCHGWDHMSYEEAARLGCSSTFCRASKRVAYFGREVRTSGNQTAFPLSSCKLQSHQRSQKKAKLSGLLQNHFCT